MVNADTLKSIKSEALQAISEFRQRQSNLAQLDDFETAMEHLQAQFLPGTQDTSSKKIGSKLFHLARDYFFLQRVSELKLAQIGDGLLDAITADNTTVLAALTRSLIEHLAALCFQVEKLLELTDRLRGQSSEKRVSELLSTSRLAVDRMYYGRGPKGSKAASVPSQFYVDDFLRSLKRRIADIDDVYNYLCELVYPNFGSNLLVSSGTLGRGRLNPTPEVQAEVVAKACHYVQAALRQAQDLTSDGAISLIRLEGYMRIAALPKQRFERIFNTPGLTHQGSGRGKDDPIYFPKARTNFEAIELIHRFLRERGAEITGPQELGGIENDFVLDVFPTSQGRFWFRTRKF